METASGVLDLPEDDADTFELFMTWAYSIYTGSINAGHVLGHIARLGLLKLYVFADKYCIDKLQETIITIVYSRFQWNKDTFDTVSSDEKFMRYLDDYMPEGAPMYKLITRALAFQMVMRAGTTIEFSRNVIANLEMSELALHHRASKEKRDGGVVASKPGAKRDATGKAVEAIPEAILRSIVTEFFAIETSSFVLGFSDCVGQRDTYVVRSRHNKK